MSKLMVSVGFRDCDFRLRGPERNCYGVLDRGNESFESENPRKEGIRAVILSLMNYSEALQARSPRPISKSILACGSCV